MAVTCSGCGGRMEFVRRHCIHCGARISNWFFQVLLQTLAVVFLGCLPFLGDSLAAKVIVLSILGAIYVSQIVILVRDA